MTAFCRDGILWVYCRMIPASALTLLLATVVSAHAAVEVPEQHRVELKNLVWIEGGEFVKGPSNKNRPTAIGRVEENQIVWNKTVFPVDSFSEKAGTVTIVFELGTLTLVRRDEKRLEGTFASASGEKHIFRTGGGW